MIKYRSGTEQSGSNEWTALILPGIASEITFSSFKTFLTASPVTAPVNHYIAIIHIKIDGTINSKENTGYCVTRWEQSMKETHPRGGEHSTASGGSAAPASITQLLLGKHNISYIIQRESLCSVCLFHYSEDLWGQSDSVYSSILWFMTPCQLEWIVFIRVSMRLLMAACCSCYRWCYQVIVLFFRVNKMNVNLWCLQADSGEDDAKTENGCRWWFPTVSHDNIKSQEASADSFLMIHLDN